MPRTYRPIKQKKVSDLVYEQLRLMIATGQICPNEKLESERALSELLGVSRTSIREALMKLECVGLIELRHGEGNYVKSVMESELSPVFAAFFKNNNSVFDLLEIRYVLESWAASTAAERATQQQIDELEQSLNKMKESTSFNGTNYEENHNFHKLISLATHNILLVHTMNTFSDWFRQLTSELYTDTDDYPNIRQALIKQHEAIFSAIKNRDKDAAFAAMNAHLEYTRKRLIKNLGS